jgi:1-acyl-sn-glycerol-3-phosphate acyltransferase
VNWVTKLLGALWGIFAWLCFGLLIVFMLVVVLVVPSADRRHKLATWTSRMAFVLPMIEVHVRGMPWRFNFVIKGEMRDFAPAHFLLRRSGAKFVDRSDIKVSTRDARQIVKAALEGESLGFFPEGTFQEEPGLLRFRPGAFVAATKGEMPVVPIAIGGSRYVLPAKRLLPRRGPLTIDILPAIAPGDPDFETSRGLAEAARQRILAVLDEPDLLPRESDPGQAPPN